MLDLKVLKEHKAKLVQSVHKAKSVLKVLLDLKVLKEHEEFKVK